MMSRDEFLGTMAAPWREVAVALWDELDRSDAQMMYADWFERAYNDAAGGDFKTWEAIQRGTFNRLANVLVPLGVTSWDDPTWHDMVPFIGGGWSMTRARNIVIREEP